MGNFLVALLEIVFFFAYGKSANNRPARIFTIVFTALVLTLLVVTVVKNTTIG